jgi:general secretion pathway protein K
LERRVVRRADERDSERGSAALLVLWGVALIFILLAPVAFTTDAELRMTENTLALARARHAAEAGTQLGLVRLLRRHDDAGAAFDGRAEAWRDGSVAVTIAIVDEAGKIDVNVAPLELIAGLFIAAGRSPEESALLACGVLERRGDAGAGCPEPGAVPVARRFGVPEELAQVPGIGAALYNRVADAVTVATGASAIDPRVASRLALLAVPGASESLVDAFLASRNDRRGLVSAADIRALTSTGYLMLSPRRDYTVTATAGAGGRGAFRADLQVRLTGRAARPYEIVAWRTPPVDRGR